MARARWTKRDPKAVWCMCTHHSTKHVHRGYRKLQGFIIRTIRGECMVEGCDCREMRWIRREYRDSLVARAKARATTTQED